MAMLIGIDGGATSTDLIIIDEHLNILHKANGLPSNYLVHGLENSVNQLAELLTGSCKEISRELEEIRFIVLGTAGAGRENDAEKLREALSEKIDSEKHDIGIHVCSDAEIALEGSFNGKPGAILIAGTGSIIYGRDESGTMHRVGGFGRLIGDEGSGYSIGRKALSMLSETLDGRSKHNSLTEKLSAKLGIISIDSLITKVYHYSLDIASVAKYVIQLADGGDIYAREILDEESDELLKHIAALQRKMHVNKMNLCLIGSLIENKNFYRELLIDKINKLLKDVMVVNPVHPPEIGAVLIGKKIFNC
ncbi:MAG: hypothetical protein K9J16_16345 [Melioribacteraceae bacterium]|nr:hypothetical protein [Melioribacteraceae bacterium]MCF8356330.1 hypothetical protein [Melioribacteraceae bacterium]MCF8395731.1 hypothetical protein [Melioribacteraceae bacterium]MCF8420882.1 hypothetical protein [Melioribacteraceae bacterium]